MAERSILVLASGPDRPGIVESLSGVIFRGGCNLEDSRMAILGGDFALMVLVRGSEESLGQVTEELESLAEEMDLFLQLKPTEARASGQDGLPIHLHAVAMDHPGIVHKVSHLLRQHSVNVTRLDTSLSHAPVSGTPVFTVELEAILPLSLPLSQFRRKLSVLSEEENIDVDLRAGE